ncbi:MAG: Flp pilus assembly complex ATPase component TadA, partial [Actinomycetota bacterium]|nr:Flp pilus assembly complex ATPase component TadA [Actinomycetota bacterium]
MEAPAPAPWPALGVLLIRDGLVNRAELEAALAEQGDGRDRRVSGQRLGEALVERGVVTATQVARLVAEQHELPFVDLEESDSYGPLATRLPVELARRCSALPIRLFPDGSLLVAVADPGRLACLDDIRRSLGVRVRWAVAAPDTIAAAIEAAEQMTLRLAEINDAETVDAEELDDDRVVELGSPDEPLAHTGSLEIQESERRPVLGSLLLRDGLVTEDELDAALAQQRLSSTRRLGEILVARGALGEDDVSRALAEQHELPFVELSEHDIDPAAAALLPVELVRRHSALPISYLADGSVLVVVADPTSSIHDEQLRADLGVSVRYAVAAARQIEIAIASAFEAEPPADTERPSVALVPALAESDEQVEIEAGEDQDPAAGVLASIMQALSLGATAIHFEPRSSGMVISGRIDGNLRELATLPNGDPVTNELGRLVGVDLTHVSRTHQRSAPPISFREDSVHLQAVVLPTTRGPRVTLRIVDKSSPGPSLSELVPDTSQREAIQNALAGRRGLLVFCGAPESRLTTTLYAALREVDTAELNVLTMEDPVERQLEGIDQIEVDPAAGVTAASGLRAILASDPDVVALGALVDDETTPEAVFGALDTLVLTTLVAPTASAGVRRLTELGGDSALVSGTLTGVVAQQIVRKTCLPCRETYYAAVDELFELDLPEEESGTRLLGRGRGCDECGDSGYQGDTRLVEVLPLTDEVRALIAAGSSAAEVEHAAGAAGMRTFREQGIDLCLEGVITT